jgi:hypothetical protein
LTFSIIVRIMNYFYSTAEEVGNSEFPEQSGPHATGERATCTLRVVQSGLSGRKVVPRHRPEPSPQ